MLKVLLLFFVLVSELRLPYAGLSGIKDDSNSKKLSILFWSHSTPSLSSPCSDTHPDSRNGSDYPQYNPDSYPSNLELRKIPIHPCRIDIVCPACIRATVIGRARCANPE